MARHFTVSTVAEILFLLAAFSSGHYFSSSCHFNVCWSCIFFIFFLFFLHTWNLCWRTRIIQLSFIFLSWSLLIEFRQRRALICFCRRRLLLVVVMANSLGIASASTWSTCPLSAHCCRFCCCRSGRWCRSTSLSVPYLFPSSTLFFCFKNNPKEFLFLW